MMASNCSRDQKYVFCEQRITELLQEDEQTHGGKQLFGSDSDILWF